MKKWEGFDECIIGQADIWRGNERVDVLVYSGDRMVDLLVQRDSMTEDEAFEFIDFNIISAYIGIDTPVISFNNQSWI